MENKKKDLPEWKWYYIIPLGRGRKDYIKDREYIEYSRLEGIDRKIYKIRKRQRDWVNYVSISMITILCLLWTILPAFINDMGAMEWLKLGMHNFGWSDWGNNFMLGLISGSTGVVVQNTPKAFPKKVQLTIESVTKLIPFLILVMCGYIIVTQRQIKKIKDAEKQPKEESKVIEEPIAVYQGESNGN